MPVPYLRSTLLFGLPSRPAYCRRCKRRLVLRLHPTSTTIAPGRVRVGVQLQKPSTNSSGLPDGVARKHVILRIYTRHGKKLAVLRRPMSHETRKGGQTSGKQTHSKNTALHPSRPRVRLGKKKKKVPVQRNLHKEATKHRQAQENLKPRFFRSFLAAWMSCAEQESQGRERKRDEKRHDRNQRVRARAR